MEKETVQSGSVDNHNQLIYGEEVSNSKRNLKVSSSMLKGSSRNSAPSEVEYLLARNFQSSGVQTCGGGSQQIKGSMSTANNLGNSEGIGCSKKNVSKKARKNNFSSDVASSEERVGARGKKACAISVGMDGVGAIEAERELTIRTWETGKGMGLTAKGNDELAVGLILSRQKKGRSVVKSNEDTEL